MARGSSYGLGSIMKYMRDGKQHGWVGKLILPSGKRKNVHGATRHAVELRMAELRREVDAGLHGTRDAEATVATYLDSWYAAHAPSLREKTALGYASLIRNRVADIAKYTLNDLKPIHIQNLYTAQLKHSAPSTVHHLHAMLKLAFKDAVRLGVLPRNPCDFVKAPPLKSQEYPTLSVSQVEALIQAAQDERSGLLIVLAISTGMRVEELLGIGWADIDHERRAVNLRNTLHTYAQDRFVLEPMKSKTSRRTLPIQPQVLRMIERQRDLQREDRELVGDAYSDAWPLLFLDPIGRPIRYDKPVRAMRHLMRRIGAPLFPKPFIEKIRFHDLRHTFATLLIADGVPIRVVSELLGHSSIGITLQIYGHVTPKMQDMANPTIEGWFPEGQE